MHPSQTLSLPASVVAIGAFDGVHKGHQALVWGAAETAAKLGVPSVAYTFDPPPKAYFQGAAVLTLLPEKLKKLEALGVEHVVVARFDRVWAARSAQQFIEELEALGPLEVWVGKDFRFGRGRAGDVEILSKRFNVRVPEPVRCRKGEVISSSRVRTLLARGATREAQLLLG